MPRSKRNKVVSLTKTSSKGKDLKLKLIEDIRRNVDEYDRIFAFSYKNMRASSFKDIRMDWKESKLYLGKVSLAQVALGKSVESEYSDNLSQVSGSLDGSSGLLFTSRPKKEVLKYFRGFVRPDFANAGFIPKENIVLPPGIMNYPGIQPMMCDHLRKLGLVVELNNGKVDLKDEFVAAQAGQALTPEQAKLLEHLNMPLAQFSVTLLCHWNKAKTAYEEL